MTLALFGSLIFVNLFGSDLIALETAPNTFRIDSLEQIYKHDNIKVIMNNSTVASEEIARLHKPLEKRLMLTK